VALRIHDNLSRTLKDFVPVTSGRVGMYVCGMTVQGPPHIGHLRAAVFGDVVRRFLAHRGYAVTLVHNFTDVDDKIIERAAEEHVDYRVIAERNIATYLDVTERMNVGQADVMPKASEHMAEIIALIADLIAKGHAYAAGGDVYFAVSSYPRYGQLSGRRVEELLAGARIEIGEHKRAPEDFTLWKGVKPGEPAWPSPWGDGRPGWHIECSAMAMRYLGPVLDLHGGGMDLVFPHHENELAQSEAATGRPFVNHWIQHGLVNLGGEKMSKSTRHFFLATDVFEEFDPAVVRYYLMTTHYRSPIEFSPERLKEADVALRRLKNFVMDAAFAGSTAGARAEVGLGHPAVEKLVSAATAEFEAGMDDDLNTARALAAIFELVREVGRLRSEEGVEGAAFAGAMGQAGRAVSELGGILGLVLDSSREAIPERAEMLRGEREQARNARDWARADSLRAEILALGFAVEDHPGGSRLKKL
jgi:cysteinyl-tRNA synthetase